MAAAKSLIRSESGKVRRVIVVGGGLAGLMTVIKLCEAGVPVDLFSLVPVKRSHSVCAQGGINACVNTKGEGDSPQVHLEETVYGGDFLANQPPVKAHVPTRRRASSTCSTAWACPSTARPRGCSTSAASAARSSTAPPSPAPPPASSSSTPSTSRCAAGRPSTSRTSTGDRVPGEKMVRKFEFWDFLSAGPRRRRRLRGIVAQDLKTMQIRAFPGDAVCWPPAAAASSSASSTQQRHLHRHRRRAPPTSRAPATPTASSSRSTPRPSPAPTSSASSARACAARAGASGCRRTKETARRPATSPRAERDYFLERDVPRLRQPRPPRHRQPRALQDLLPREARRLQRATAARTRTRSTSTSPTCRREAPAQEARRHAGDLREVRRRGPVHEPDEGLPRRALLDGRPLGRLRARRARLARDGLAAQPRDQHPRASTPSARSTTSTTAPTASAPTRCSRASGAGMATGPAVASYQKNLARSACDMPSRSSRRRRSAQDKTTRRILKQNQDKKDAENPYLLHEELGAARCSATAPSSATTPRSTRCSRRSSELDERSEERGVDRRRRPADQPGRAVRPAPAEHDGARPRHRAGRAATATSRAARTTSRRSPSATTRTGCARRWPSTRARERHADRSSSSAGSTTTLARAERST